MLDQLLSVIGAVLILGAYAANQRGWAGRENRWYNIANFFGSAVLAWVAIVDRRLGFILLEVIWALLSVPGMLRPARGRRPPAA